MKMEWDSTGYPKNRRLLVSEMKKVNAKIKPKSLVRAKALAKKLKPKMKWKVADRFWTPIDATGCYWDVEMVTSLKDPEHKLSAALSCAATHKPFKLGYKTYDYVGTKVTTLVVQETYYTPVK